MDQNYISLDASFIEEIIQKLEVLKHDIQLQQLGAQIVQQMDTMRTQGGTGQSSKYWKNLFPSSDSDGYISLRRSVKSKGQNTNDTILIKQYHALQKNIELFLARFLNNKDVTSYAIYYEDEFGNFYRADLSNSDDQIMEQLYSTSTAQLMRLTTEARNSLKNMEQNINLTSHITKYIADTQSAYPQDWRGSINKTVAARKAGKRARYNLGHIMEAFERHYQSIHGSLPPESDQVDWSKQELISNIKASLNNAPWYTGGDVANKQVKFLAKYGSVRTGSQSSIEALGNFIRSLMKEKYSVQDIRKIAISVYKGIEGQKTKLNSQAEKTIDGLIEQYLTIF